MFRASTKKILGFNQPARSTFKHDRNRKRILSVGQILSLGVWLSTLHALPLTAQLTASASENQLTVPLGISLDSYPYPYPVHFLEFNMQGFSNPE
jgi:hypothetical protein